MTESDPQVTKIVGSGAPVGEAADEEGDSGSLEYDEVHRFLGEMAERQEEVPAPQRES